MMVKKRRCSRCEEWKPADQFYGKKRKSSMCKPCYNATYTHDYRVLLRERNQPILPIRIKQGVTT